jgi:hypothetical protein
MRTLLAAAICGLGQQAAPWALAQAPAGSGDTGGSLSDKLNRNNGVIAPKQNPDPEMRRKPPPAQTPTTVIPPPGSPGGNPRVKPK